MTSSGAKKSSNRLRLAICALTPFALVAGYGVYAYFNSLEFRYPKYFQMEGAIEADDVVTVRKLLEMGADPNEFPSGEEAESEEVGQCALNQAIREGHSEIVRLLLNHGSDPNLKDGFFSCPLEVAVTEGTIDDMVTLVRAGAKPNNRAGGSDPLRMAALDGKTDKVSYLLLHGANPNTVSNDGQTVLSEMHSLHLIYPRVAKRLKAAGGHW